jgi:raffinose/stachyose/melibiose transport system permease protein
MSKKKWTMLLMELVTALLFIFMFSPFYIVFVNAFKNRFQVLTDVIGLPEQWGQISANLKAVITSPNLKFWSSATSSVIITVTSLLLIALFSSMAGWALVRSKSRTSQWLFMMYVAAMVVPFQVVMLPLVAWMRVIGDVTGLARTTATA